MTTDQTTLPVPTAAQAQQMRERAAEKLEEIAFYLKALEDEFSTGYCAPDYVHEKTTKIETRLTSLRGLAQGIWAAPITSPRSYIVIKEVTR